MPRRFVLAAPPDPANYKSGMDWRKAAYSWMQAVKGNIEAVSRFNAAPTKSLHVGSYTPNTFIDASTSGPDLADFVCTLTAYLQDRGIIPPTSGNLGARAVVIWPGTAIFAGTGSFVGVPVAPLQGSAVFAGHGGFGTLPAVFAGQGSFTGVGH